MKQFNKRALATILMGGVMALGVFAALLVAKPANAARAIGVSANVRLLQQAAPGLYRPFPQGIAAHNKAKAWNQIKDRASWDDQYANVIAQQTGAGSFDPSQYKPSHYQNGMRGTSNSALNGAGQIVGLQDHDGSGHVRVLVVININTSKTIAFMVRCGNPRLRHVPVIPWHRFKEQTLLYINRMKTKVVSIVCPSGQKVTATLKVWLHGIVKAKTWGRVKGKLKAHLKAGFKGQIKVVLKLECGPAPPPTTTTVTTTTSTTVTTTTQTTTTETTTTTTPPSVTITSCDTLNQVPAGQPSGELFCTVNASAAGSFTVNPDLGSVSDCNGGSRQSVLTIPLVAGNNTICYYYYAPDDADQPPTDTLTYTAIVTTDGGTAKDSKSQTFKITYPVR